MSYLDIIFAFCSIGIHLNNPPLQQKCVNKLIICVKQNSLNDYHNRQTARQCIQEYITDGTN